MRSLFQKFQFKKKHALIYMCLFAVVGFSFWNLETKSLDKTVYENIDLSSVARKDIHELHKIDPMRVNSLSIQKFPQKQQKFLPKRFSSNPAFQVFGYLQNKIGNDSNLNRQPASE